MPSRPRIPRDPLGSRTFPGRLWLLKSVQPRTIKLAQLRSPIALSSGTRHLDSPDGPLEVQGAIATHEGGDVLGQDHAFLVDRRLSQEGGEDAKERPELGF